jgi:hypothetical protein
MLCRERTDAASSKHTQHRNTPWTKFNFVYNAEASGCYLFGGATRPHAMHYLAVKQWEEFACNRNNQLLKPTFACVDVFVCLQRKVSKGGY